MIICVCVCKAVEERELEMRGKTSSHAYFQTEGALHVAKCGSRNKDENAHHWAKQSAEKTPLSASYFVYTAKQEDNHN